MEPESSTPTLPWHQWSARKVLAHWQVSAELGLPAEEVTERRLKFGLNVVPERRWPSWYESLWHQLRSPLMVLLLVAAVLSLGLGDTVDASVIGVAVLLNVGVGVLQESRAQSALKKLAKVVVPTALVVRAGDVKEVPAAELVPGDVLLLAAGSHVPADVRLLSVEDLEVDESSLTGESVPVAKDPVPLPEATPLAERVSCAYRGTSVVRGSGRAVVVAVGLATEVGRTVTQLRQSAEVPTPLQRRLAQLSYTLSAVVVAVAIVVLGVGLLRGVPWLTMVQTGVAVAVAAIPESLLVGVTAILAVGMRRLLRRKALVRQLLAAETLGSTTVLCVDKTGTITEGKMEVSSIVTAAGELRAGELPSSNESLRAVSPPAALALEVAVLTNEASVVSVDGRPEAWQVRGNYTDEALLRVAGRVGLTTRELLGRHPRLDHLGFHSARRYTASINSHAVLGRTLFVKGAPEVVLGAVTQVYRADGVHRLSPEARTEWQGRVAALAERGLRVIALAYRVLDGAETAEVHEGSPVLVGLTLVGVVSFADPLRPGIGEVLRRAEASGLRPVIITGDSPVTARAIAGELGLPLPEGAVVEGAELDQLTDEQLADRIEQVRVFARTAPSGKIRIVRAWQARGAVVAMTGDGINDAAAMDAADIGVGLGSGTAVARETADLVLLDSDFRTLVTAVVEGRIIFDNVRKVTLYLIGDAFAAVIVVVGGLLLGLPLPLLAAQVLWVNLLTDGLPNVALTVEPSEREVLAEAPPGRDEPLLGRRGVAIAAATSATIGLGSLGLFAVYWQASGDEVLARTVAFTALSCSTLAYVFSVRSLRKPLLSRQFFANPWLLVAVASGLVLQLLAVYWRPLGAVLGTVPLEAGHWQPILLVCLLTLAVTEAVKLVTMPRLRASRESRARI